VPLTQCRAHIHECVCCARRLCPQKERGLVTELEGLRTKVQIQADTIQVRGSAGQS